MQEDIELFIKCTEISEPNLETKIEQYKQLLRDIATGTWTESPYLKLPENCNGRTRPMDLRP